MKTLIKLISFFSFGLSLEEKCKKSKNELTAVVQKLDSSKVELVRIKNI